MTFHFLSPENWTIVANTSVEKEYGRGRDLVESNCIKSAFEKVFLDSNLEDFVDGQKYYRFKQTKTLSTYLFAFVGGPYKYIEYDGCDGEAKYPMRIYCNEDILQYCEA